MTGRGWWTLFACVTLLLVGIFRNEAALSVTGLTLVLWVAWEWLFFSLRVRLFLRNLKVERAVGDDRGPLATLWQGREYTVTVTVSLAGKGRFPYVAVADCVPFAVQHLDGSTIANGGVSAKESLTVTYRVACPLPGVARFEGVRYEVTDLQGFFAHVGFLRNPILLRVLPGVLVHRSGGPTVKRQNELMPPGIHHLRQPGSGSELLDLRDYLPGDPPRTIAWKVSARRDKLITKEFESEVPVRCTLFVDVSSSVRVISPGRVAGGGAFYKPLDRLIELAAGVLRANASLRDLTGLCLFDETGSRIVRPERTSNHQTRLLQLLGEAGALGPMAGRADPNALLPIAYAFAQEVYPELLRDEVNRIPAWLTWLVPMPRYTRHRRGKLEALHRSKRTLLLWGTTLIPLSLLIVNLVVAYFGEAPEWARTLLGGLLFFGGPALATGAWLLFLFSLLTAWRLRKLTRWRKKLAALFCVLPTNASLPPTGGLAALLEDDDLFSLHLQHFLAEHQVPCAVPLYDAEGRYLFAVPEKVEVLAKALLQAVQRGRDNELFVLLADLLELDHHLEPLLAAVRVAVGRHHQVLVVCPWPHGVSLPGIADDRRTPREDTLPGLILALSHARLHAAFGRVRRAFARLGVQVACAASHESVPLVLDRIERLRSARRIPGGKP